MGRLRIFSAISLSAWLLHFYPAASQQASDQNSAPVVTILAPAKGLRFQWNSIVPYAIKVSDREDGSSEYQEIATNEVLVVIAFLNDTSRTKKYLSDLPRMNLEPVRLISTSGCFTCHATKSKLIGPSFEAVAKRYSNNLKMVESITQKIIMGSTGTWGDLKMPAHPDLQSEQVKEIVHWILKNNLDPNVNYFAGTEGAFRTKEKNEKENGKGVYVLTAIYLDHGTAGGGDNKKQSQHSIALKN